GILGLDHLIEQCVVALEGFAKVVVVFFLSHVNGGNEMHLHAVFFVGGDGGFEASAAVVVIDEAEELAVLLFGFCALLLGGEGGLDEGNQRQAHQSDQKTKIAAMHTWHSFGGDSHRVIVRSVLG